MGKLSTHQNVKPSPIKARKDPSQGIATPDPELRMDDTIAPSYLKNLENRQFFTVNDLIVHGKVSHSSLAHEINQRGVFRKIAPGKTPMLLEPQAGEVIDLLTDLSTRQLIDNGLSNNHDFEIWFDQQDRCYFFGWPPSESPAFVADAQTPWLETMESIKDPRSLLGGPLVTVGRCLVFDLASVGDIATVIDHDGIFWLDHYNRVTHVNTPDVLSDLRLVLRGCAKATFGGKALPATFFSEPALSRFGWSKENLPNFPERLAQIKQDNREKLAAQKVETSPLPEASVRKGDQDSGNGYTAQVNLLAALMSFIRGEITPEAHPNFVNQSDLIRLLTDKFPDIYGLRADNLKKKFADANKRGRPELALPPIKDTD